MKTKKVYYWVDLPPNWDNQQTNGAAYIPFLSLDAPQHEITLGWKRIKVAVEFPIFGGEDQVITAESKDVTGGFKP